MSSSQTEDSEEQLSLLKLSDDEVAELWDKGVREKLEEVLSAQVRQNPRLMNNIYLGLMSDELGLYAFLRGRETMALALTSFQHDPPMERKFLLLYALVGLQAVEDKFWKKGFEQLQEIAFTLGCAGISAYTANPRVIELTKLLGGTIENYISLEIK